MSEIITAIYQQSVLRPLRPLSLPLSAASARLQFCYFAHLHAGFSIFTKFRKEPILFKFRQWDAECL